VCFDVRGVDHLRIRRSPAPGQLSEQALPQSASCPAYEAVIDRRRRAIFWRVITPPASALEHTHDPADYPPIIDPLNAAHIGRQMRLDLRLLLVAQPKRIPAHDPDPLPKTNQHRMESGLSCFSTTINEF